MDFYKEKGITIKRIELDKGGVVISLSDYLKQKEKPKLKKIDLAQGDFEKTVAGLSDSDKATIKDLLRKWNIVRRLCNNYTYGLEPTENLMPYHLKLKL